MQPPDDEPVRISIDGILDLHAFAPKDIASVVEEYLQECLKKGIFEVRIIHGKGRGILGAAGPVGIPGIECGMQDRVAGVVEHALSCSSLGPVDEAGSGVELAVDLEVPAGRSTTLLG